MLQDALPFTNNKMARLATESPIKKLDPGVLVSTEIQYCVTTYLIYHFPRSTLLVRDLGTFCSCPRLVSGASMNGFILTLTGEECTRLLISLWYYLVDHFLKGIMILEDV